MATCELRGKLDKIKETIIEYGCNPEEFSAEKLAIMVYNIAVDDDRVMCPTCGANLAAWKIVFGEEHNCG